MTRLLCKLLSVFGVVCVFMTAGVSSTPRDRLPDATLEVTVQQKVDGRTEKGLHLLNLQCWDGKCSLTSLTLNQCGTAGSGKLAFYPKINRTSTEEGNLSVKDLGGVLEVKQSTLDIGGESTATFRIGYAIRAGVGAATEVTSFSGGYVKHSVLLKRVVTVEYAPLIGSFHEIPLDCAVLLPGVEIEK
jgi:hypothetical protein